VEVDDEMPKLETVKVGSSSDSSDNSDDENPKAQKQEEEKEDVTETKGTSLQYEIADGLEVIEGEGDNN